MKKGLFAYALLIGMAITLCAVTNLVSGKALAFSSTQDQPHLQSSDPAEIDDLDEVEPGFEVLAAAQQGGVVELSGDITKNTKLTPKNRYLLKGGVFVRAGATLKIKAGTTIFGGAGSFLVIDRGAKIDAQGKATKPIVFTSAQDAGNRKRADWGGLIINGFAPINVPGGQADGEGNTGKYGGTNPADDSGILQYVRVEFSGNRITPTNELNGIAFQGVGNKTVVDYVQSTESADDTMEFFGGTVNVKHIVLFGGMDDAFDWTFGYSGKAQFVLAMQDGSVESDNGIEADNNEENNELLPRSNPTLYNLTLIGDQNAQVGSTTLGMLLRRGTAATIRNFVVSNFKGAGIRVRDDATINQLSNGALKLEGGVVFSNKGGFAQFQRNDGSAATDMSSNFKSVAQADPMLTNMSLTAPNFRPKTGSPALVAANVQAPPTGDSFFERTTFLGGIGPNEADDWTKGWVSYVRK
ncbi:MAG: hypothetical protein K1Y36_21470 [Blastocatellia bacterium]|nr:hypothetical protein [Blastocatellia bacterium]